MPAVLVLNGPNLNLLGTRQPEVYGSQTLEMVEDACRAHGAATGLSVTCLQSNHEGALIDAIHGARGNQDGIVLNAGAFTHTSVALMDAIASVNRATLPGCVLSLALVADLADLAIRGGVSAFDMIKVGPNITPGQPTDFVTEWPVTIAMEGPYGAIARLVDRVTDPQHAEALLGATLKQPGGRTGRTPDGVVRFEATLAAAVVRPAVDLGLDRSEQ